jgi:hypothetical protein
VGALVVSLACPAQGSYTLMSRATDEVGRVQSHEPRYNNMRKNFSAIVGYTIIVA